MEGKDLTTQDWYIHLVNDCKSIITEAVFMSRWALVEGYWSLGRRIEEETRTRPINVIQLLQDLAKSISISYRTGYYAHQIYLKYPDIQQIPEGKSITWNKLITKYLPKVSVEKETPPLVQGKFSVIYAGF